MKKYSLPKPMKVLRIHLNADLLRNGKIIAPKRAVKLIKVTEINPTTISSIFIRFNLYENVKDVDILFHLVDRFAF